MPLYTQVVREDKPREIRWGWFHLEACRNAITIEGGDYEYKETGEHTFKGYHEFVDEEDGEIFILLPGDTFRAWR